MKVNSLTMLSVCFVRPVGCYRCGPFRFLVLRSKFMSTFEILPINGYVDDI